MIQTNTTPTLLKRLNAARLQYEYFTDPRDKKALAKALEKLRKAQLDYNLRNKL